MSIFFHLDLYKKELTPEQTRKLLALISAEYDFLVSIDPDLLEEFNKKLTPEFKIPEIFKKKDFQDIEDEKNIQVSDEATKLFRKLSKIHHPDKGGDSEVFQIILEKYKLDDVETLKILESTKNMEEFKSEIEISKKKQYILDYINSIKYMSHSKSTLNCLKHLGLKL